jgi:FkbM family methyltransferase
MTTLGSKGRFGNQLLQYAFVRLHAKDHQLVAEFPDWIGRDLFDLADPFPSAPLPSVDETEFGSSLSGPAGQALSERDISGYFVGSKAEWKSRAAEFRALFTPGRNIRPLLDRAWHALEAAGKTVVAIHLRRADFGYGRFWIAPPEWYLAWLRTVWPGLDKPILYVATDDTELISKFAEFSPWDSSRIGVAIPGADFMIDHHILRHASHVAISNSTFSFTAAMLNERALTFVRPHPNRRELVAFDPWSADVLLDPVIEHDRIAAPQLNMLHTLFKPYSVVVHVGRHCSPWTHLARSIHPEMKIHELENEASLDVFRRHSGAKHIVHVVVEDAKCLAQVSAGASATFSHSRVDMVHFRVLPESGRPTLPSELAGNGYVLFVALDRSFKRLDGNAPLATGCYVAVHERLIPLLLRQKEVKELPIDTLCRKHGIAVRGVLHVGAHEGQELSIYDSMGVKQTVFIEANPAVYARLAAAMRGRSDVMTVNRAIDEKAGRVTLHLASFDQSSSLLQMAATLDVYPQIVPAGTVDVDATTLDALSKDLKLLDGQFNLLNIDVQGAEARVLRGAQNVLRHIDAVAIEVNFVELYRGCAQIEDIDEILGSAGFRRVATVNAFHWSWGDAFYVRSSASGGL